MALSLFHIAAERFVAALNDGVSDGTIPGACEDATLRMLTPDAALISWGDLVALVSHAPGWVRATLTLAPAGECVDVLDVFETASVADAFVWVLRMMVE